MSEPVTNGAQYPLPQMNMQSLQVDENLDLRDLLIERGTSGLRRSGGYVREDLLVELTGQRGVATFKEMKDNSAVVGSCLYALECLVRNVRWSIKPADTSDEAKKYADLLSGMLFDDLSMPWSL